MEWISVKDRYPEYGVFVLTNCMAICQRLKREPNDYWEDNSCCEMSIDEDGIQWVMPLPSKPE